MNERIVATSTSTGKKFCLQHELLLQLVKEKREKRMQVELVREGNINCCSNCGAAGKNRTGKNEMNTAMLWGLCSFLIYKQGCVWPPQ
jgi:hypothetical protein